MCMIEQMCLPTKPANRNQITSPDHAESPFKAMFSCQALLDLDMIMNILMWLLFFLHRLRSVALR